MQDSMLNETQKLETRAFVSRTVERQEVKSQAFEGEEQPEGSCRDISWVYLLRPAKVALADVADVLLQGTVQ